jgi:cysteine desulfuration protein SufE
VTAGAGTLNPRLRDIAEDFGAVPAKERLQLLLEFSEELPPLPARYAECPDLLEQVPECQSPLFLAVEVDDSRHCSPLLRRAARRRRPTRGFAGILCARLDGLGAGEILTTPRPALGDPLCPAPVEEAQVRVAEQGSIAAMPRSRSGLTRSCNPGWPENSHPGRIVPGGYLARLWRGDGWVMRRASRRMTPKPRSVSLFQGSPGCPP